MPWTERSIVSIRKDFVLKALAKDEPVTELCRRFGISRKTGYKWLARFKAQGIDGLVDESRRLLSSPNAVSLEMPREILEIRRSHCSWGVRKIRTILRRTHSQATPSTSTIMRVLERHGCSKKKRRRRASPKVFFTSGAPTPVVEESNDLWTVDFKGWWRARDGARCEPLTVRDAFSRYVLAIRLLDDTAAPSVRAVFAE